MGSFFELFSKLSDKIANVPDYYYLIAAVLFALIFFFTVKR